MSRSPVRTILGYVLLKKASLDVPSVFQFYINPLLNLGILFYFLNLETLELFGKQHLQSTDS